MPQWAGSCWYYIRYIDPHNSEQICDPKLLDKWLPVDLYVGGAEHAVLHLLYSRFWHKVLYDCGVVKCKEPWQRLVHQSVAAVFIPLTVPLSLKITPLHRNPTPEIMLLPTRNT